jgi:hypothetical protein
MAKKPRKQWVLSPSKSPTAVPPAIKLELEKKAGELIEKVLKPKHVKPPPIDAYFNYISDITTKWHGSWFYFVATYACPGPNALSPTFETKFARLKHVGLGKFNLSFQRHTGEWIEIYTGQTVAECLKSIEEDPWFLP